MNELAREKLRQIVGRCGEEVLRDRSRCEGLLKDHCGSCRLEISALMGALEERVPVELNSSWQSSMTPEAMRARMVQRLHEQRGLTPEVAAWAVDAWSYALDVNLGRISDPIDQGQSGDSSLWVGAGGDAAPGAEASAWVDPSAPAGSAAQDGRSQWAPTAEWVRQRKGPTAAVALIVLLIFAYASGYFGEGLIRTVPDNAIEQNQKSAEQLLAAAAGAGASVRVRIDQTVDSDHAAPGQQISGAVVDPVVVDGQEVIPAGSPALLRVTGVKSAGHFKGVPEVQLQLAQVSLAGRAYAVASRSHVARGKSRGKDTAVKTGLAAAGGGILGGILKKGKGAAVGAAAGAGGALGFQAATKAEPAVIPAESVISFSLVAPRAEKQ